MKSLRYRYLIVQSQLFEQAQTGQNSSGHYEGEGGHGHGCGGGLAAAGGYNAVGTSVAAALAGGNAQTGGAIPANVEGEDRRRGSHNEGP